MFLTPQQARLQDDLRGVIEGDVQCDDVTSQLYATDASMFECRPLGVIWPRSTKDVVAAVRYAAESHIPIHARGSGTGSAGGAIGRGLIIDFTRHMRRLLYADEESASVLPGAVRERLNFLLRQTKQHFFAPSAGHFPTCTLGSILATDCVGPRWLRDGFPHDHVRELEIVTADGTVHQLRPEPVFFDDSGQVIPQKNASNLPSLLDNENGLWRQLIPILREARSAIRTEQDATSPDCSGYRLEGVLTAQTFNPTRLITGSEGTLGIITRATISTSPLSAHSGSIVFLFDGLDKAARSVPTILKSNPTLCDMIDRRIINMLCEWDKRFLPILPSDTEVAVIVEIDAETSDDLTDRMNQLVHRIRNVERLSFGSWFAWRQVERDLFRDLLRKAKGALLRIRHSCQVISLLEDVEVPVRHLPAFLHSAQNILKKYGVTYSVSGHIGQGQVRIQPILDPLRSDLQLLLVRLTNEIYNQVFRFGGSVGSAQGNGRARTSVLLERYPKLAPFFVRIKNLFDPHNILNPNIIVSEEMRAKYRQPLLESATSSGTEPEKTTPVPDSDYPWQLPFRSRLGKDSTLDEIDEHKPQLKNQLELQLKWEPEQVQENTYQCTGCGLCRIRTMETRMCPTFRNIPNEDDTCRTKANLLRGVLDGTLSLETLTDDVSKSIADSCIFCHCCPQECPAQVDVPELVFRIKNAYNASHGLCMRDKIFSNIDIFLGWISFFKGPFTCKFIKRYCQWTMKAMLGIPLRFKIPEMKRYNPFRRTGRRKYARLTQGGEKKVALFLDTYATFFDPLLIEAAVKILEHNGIDFYIPPRQKSSGHEAFAFGNGDRAESTVRHNVNILAEAIRQRCQIVTLEPVSAVCIKREYKYVRNDEETRAVADNTTDICTWLYSLHREGKLKLDFHSLPQKTAGYHAPCRTLAETGLSVAQATPAEELLRLIPGLEVQRLERGCCGMAGAIGMIRENYKMSLRLSNPLALALRDPEIDFGATECSACKIQMQQRGDKPTYHPLILLAAAYGLMELNSDQRPQKDKT